MTSAADTIVADSYSTLVSLETGRLRIVKFSPCTEPLTGKVYQILFWIDCIAIAPTLISVSDVIGDANRGCKHYLQPGAMQTNEQTAHALEQKEFNE